MHENDEENRIELLHETAAPSNSTNGFKIIIPIKYGDRLAF